MAHVDKHLPEHPTTTGWWALTFRVPAYRWEEFVAWAEGLPIAGMQQSGEEAWTIYVPETHWQDEWLQTAPFNLLQKEYLPPQNWNRLWEQNYPPIWLPECGLYIRAPFHEEKPEALLSVVIKPGMAFGTGHHVTTQMMAGWLMELPLERKAVLDVGTGSGILAIVAALRGAHPVVGVDIDPVALDNARANAQLNRVDVAFYARIQQVPDRFYDYILANIELNILTQLLPEFKKRLAPQGTLLVSGLLTEQQPAWGAAARSYGLQPVQTRQMGAWIAQLLRHAREN